MVFLTVCSAHRRAALVGLVVRSRLLPLLGFGLALGGWLPPDQAFGQDHPKTSLSRIRIAPDHRAFVTEDGKPFVPWGVTTIGPAPAGHRRSGNNSTPRPRGKTSCG